jgi:hypothetical protein
MQRADYVRWVNALHRTDRRAIAAIIPHRLKYKKFTR